MAVFGGTFDPVHLGHLHAARVAREALGGIGVTLLPAARPWHRPPPLASAMHRCRMLELAADGEDLAVSRLEIDRPGPSYAVDTLRELAGARALRDAESHTSVVWCIGGDALGALETWHRAEQLPSLCNLLVFERPGSPRARPPQGFDVVDAAACLGSRRSGGVHFLDAPMLDISATAVRRAIARGDATGVLLPRQVWDYIRRYGLYARPAGRTAGNAPTPRSILDRH